MAVFRDLRLLLWKNYILQIRHPIVTIAEILIPCVFAVMLAVIRMKVDITKTTNATIYESFHTNYVPELKFGDFSDFRQRVVIYSPNTSQVYEFMSQLSETMSSEIEFKVIGFNSEEEMVSYYVKQEIYVQNLIFCGIVFMSANNLEKELKYKLRFSAAPQHSAEDITHVMKDWMTQYTFPLFQKPGPRVVAVREGGYPGYYEEGFLAIQHNIALTAAKRMINDSTDDSPIDDRVRVLMQRFPYGPYVEDLYLLALQFLFPLILMYSFIYPAVNLTKNIVIEKEKRLKESMKMMGLKSWVHWMAWFIKSFIWLALSSALLTILLTIRLKDGVGVLDQSSPLMVYLFFISYSISSISFAFLMSTFFSKANVSAIGAGVLFFMTFLPYFVFFPRYRDMSAFEKLVVCLFSNTGLAFGSMLIAMWEGNSVGIQLSNIALTASPDDTLRLIDVIILFYVDAFIYIVLTLYIESVFPGEYGIPLKWYFPLTRNYWFGHKSNSNEKIESNNTTVNEFFETEPNHLKSGIKIINLSKTFDEKKYVVKNLNLNAYKGQITALLGHNGAGKTTTMSILTGLFPPLTGTAVVNGYDISKDIDKVRTSLGICPQFDVLFDEMTVEEHLKFFCQLKDFDKKELGEEVKVIIKLLGLEDKTKKQSKTLSGGQKRKLSIGIALVGKSEIVILDEPTSGMDVYARRFTWDLLLAEKVNRTILLSTHFMEEADILSERIAIMSNGAVQCCGSPLFLKNKYGIGYNLTIVKKSGADDTPITQLIQSHIKEAKLQTSAGTEVSYSLPKEKSQQFEELFAKIESEKRELEVDSYGISITTMEEVFLKVGEYAEKGIEALNTNHNNDQKEVSLKMNKKTDDRNRGFSLIGQQFYGLFSKRILYSVRNLTLTLSQLLIPWFFTTLILLVIKSWPKLSDQRPSLVLNVDPFKGTEIPFLVTNKTNPKVQQIVNYYKSQFSGDNRVKELYFNTKELRQSMVKYVLEESKKDIAYFNLHVPIGAIVCDNTERECSPDIDKNGLVLTGLFNNQPFHSIATSLATLDLAVVRYLATKPNYLMEVSNHPMPRTTADNLKIAEMSQIRFHLSWVLLFSMAFLGASFSVFLVKESSAKLKHLQKVSGVKLYVFWLTTFLWDYLIYMITCLLIMVMYYILGQEPLRSAALELKILVIFVVYGFSLLPFIYLMTFLFDTPSTAYVRICLFSMIAGIGAFVAVMIMELPLLDLKSMGETLDWIFSAFIPNYGIGRSLYLLYNNYLGNKYCNSDIIQKTCNTDTIDIKDFIKNIQNEFKEMAAAFEQYLPFIENMGNISAPVPKQVLPCCKNKCNDTCFPWIEDYLGVEKPGIGSYLVLFAIQCVVFWSLIILTECSFFRNTKNLCLRFYLCSKRLFKSYKQRDRDFDVDSDVRIEEKRINYTKLKELFKTDALVIKKLTKYYGDFCAVDRISYGVQKGECFGLLGVNGAGKTTTFKMITCDETITDGNIYVNGCNVELEVKEAQKQMGYCPQFDGLLDQLTGKETLVLFCRLRGIKESDIGHQILYLSKLLYFDMHINQLVKNYSGGTKRKLSTAVALLGEPSVSFLDEPTTGVDPVARRCLWDALTKKLSEGHSIVLTSHSMEECEALCNRLIIMVNGKIACIGSPQHLKNKFGKGYTVHIKVTIGRHLPQTMKKVEEFMKNTFEGTDVKEIHYNYLNFQINNTSINWSQIFGSIEREKESLNIEDYSVGQTTLEQIFLTFAAKQKAD